MKRFLKKWFSLIGMLLILGANAETLYAAPITPEMSWSVGPRSLRPAQAGYAYVGGGYPLDVSISLDGKPLDVFWTGSGYMALFAFDFDEPPGQHRLTIGAFNPGTQVVLDEVVIITVEEYEFPFEEVGLPVQLLRLLDRELNEAELAMLDEVYAGRTQPLRWDWPYISPVPGELITSRFGGDRVYNGGMWESYHTGTDFRRFVGDPVQATADGVVVVAEEVDIRGNLVIIDHGYGVFSQYAHQSELLVQVGDHVKQGQTVGLAGGTGRSVGPHLHFEIIVNGITVDPIRWMALNPAFVTPREAP